MLGGADAAVPRLEALRLCLPAAVPCRGGAMPCTPAEAAATSRVCSEA